MPDEEMMKFIEEGCLYKYLGILEADGGRHEARNKKTRKEQLYQAHKEFIKICVNAVLILKRGKAIRSEGVVVPDEEMIKFIEEGCLYKYLGILEVDGARHKVMNEKTRKEQLNWTCKEFRTQSKIMYMMLTFLGSFIS